MMASRVVTAAAPMASVSCRTVVSGGRVNAARSMSSNPVIDTSSRHPQAVFVQRAEDADGHHVALGDDGGEVPAGFEQVERGAVGALGGPVRPASEVGFLGDAGRAERRADAGEPVAAGRVGFGAGDPGDAAVPEREEVFGDLPGAVGVVRGDVGRVRPGADRVDEDGRQSGLDQGLDPHVVRRAGDHDRAGHSPGPQQPHVAVAGRAGRARGHQQVVAGLGGRRLNVMQHVEVEVVLRPGQLRQGPDVVGEESERDRLGAGPGQALRGDVGLVAQAGRGCLDPGPGRVLDLRRAGQHARNRRPGHPGQARHLLARGHRPSFHGC